MISAKQWNENFDDDDLHHAWQETNLAIPIQKKKILIRLFLFDKVIPLQGRYDPQGG